MDLIQLKMPPERASLVADAIERLPSSDWQREHQKELSEVLTWLRYRLALWDTRKTRKKAA